MYAKDHVTIVDRREMLRVKLKSLGEEARIIRKEERRTHGELREALYLHRILNVRSESRAAHLAYGFIRGIPLAAMERNPRPQHEHPVDWDKVANLCKRYGPKDMAMPEGVPTAYQSRFCSSAVEQRSLKPTAGVRTPAEAPIAA